MSKTRMQPSDTGLPVGTFLVPLDGSDFAERAIGPAGRLAAALGAEVRLWKAGPGQAIPPGQGSGHQIVCLATHGHNHTAPLVHSVSAAVVAAADGPVLLIGPNVPPEPPEGTRLAVFVDGTKESEGLLPVAAAWARALDLSVTILTVAEPVPESVRHPGSYPRLHGPHGDADAYVAGLVSAWDGPVPVAGRALYDPVDVNGPLVTASAEAGAALIVMGTKAPRGLRRLIFGSTAAAVAHDAAVPVLVVPL